MAAVLKILKYSFLTLFAIYLISIPADLIRHFVQSFYDGDRSPYVQMLGTDRVTVRWQTETQEQTKIKFGSSKHQMELSELTETTTDHSIAFEKLVPNTQYFYQVITSESNYPITSFYTNPTAQSEEPIRIWVQGDAGLYNENAKKNFQVAKQRAADYGRLFDLWLTTGDNAYKSGKGKEYQKHVFTPYAEWLAQLNYWPAYGNHDNRRFTYDMVFSMPEHGEMGGVPSDSGRYFSFDYAYLHVVFLDSTSTHLFRYHKMMAWLEEDLAANNKPWTIVVFHEPPYSKGSHDSDNWLQDVGRLINAREIFLPVLEKYSVDLVLNGHSHAHERSHLIRCHYDYSETFENKMLLQAGNSYTKPLDRTAERQGTVYQTIGSTSKVTKRGSYDHPAMPVHQIESGTLFITLDKDKLVSEFVNLDGEVKDSFSITKTGKPLYSEQCN